MAHFQSSFVRIMRKMAMQFDVFTNPIVAARRAYPFVVVMQSDFAETTRDRLVAPVVLRQRLAPVAGKLTPIVEIESAEYVVLVPDMMGVRRGDLVAPVCSVASHRAGLLDAVDYLFFGI